MKLLISHTDIGSIESISQLDMADATLEAVDVVEQQQRLDYHGSSATLRGNRKENDIVSEILHGTWQFDAACIPSAL